jgi:hypothetical protein
MTVPLTFVVPEALSDPALYKRIGAVIWEISNNKIAGHVQEKRGFELLSRLPIPGGNPLNLAVDAMQSGQMVMIQRTLNSVQSLATVGAVASVASLGVSIAGFAVVLAKLNRMDGKLDKMLGETARLRGLVEGLGVKVDALPMSQLRARLEEVGLARRYDPIRRRDSLRDSVEKLSELRHFYGSLLASPDFCSLGTDNMLALADTHERLVAACQGELFAEFMLGGDPGVMAERWRLQQKVFETVAWSDSEALYDLTAQGDRDAGVFKVTKAEDRLARVQTLAAIREESIARLASMPLLTAHLHERGVTADEYMRALDEQEQIESALVVLDARAA